MNYFADVTDEKVSAVGPLQAPGWSEPTVAKLLNLPPEKIEIQMTRMAEVLVFGIWTLYLRSCTDLEKS
jgi:hypothetical protein